MNGCSVLNWAVVFCVALYSAFGFFHKPNAKDWLDKPLFRLYNVDKREEFS